jgi:integrase/recombinase XerD
MGAWGWNEIQPWLELRLEMPVGPLFCVINDPTCGRQWSCAAAGADLRRTAVAAGVAGGSRRTSSGTHTPSRWRAKGCR